MASSKTVLFLDHAEALGGAERVLFSLLERLDNNQYQIHIISQPGELATLAATLPNVTVHEMQLPQLRGAVRSLGQFFKTAQCIATLAIQINATCIYGNTIRTAFYGKLAGFLARKPFVWHMHDFWLSESKPKYIKVDAGLKRLLSWNAYTVAISQAVAAKLPRQSNIWVVHNGIDVTQFTSYSGKNLFRQTYEIGEDVPLIGMIGRLRPWKGQARFLRMAAQVVQSVPNAHFAIVGGTPFQIADDYPERLHRLAYNLGLSERVTFTGQLEDIRASLADFDIFVHPGDPEPFGLVNVEAMAMSKPIVALNHGALPEIVVPGETGLLVLPDDESCLAQAVIGLLQTPEQRESMGRAGHERVLTYFTVERMVREIETILYEVVTDS